MDHMTLSSETVVDIAKHMLVAWECQWKLSNGKCKAVLGSWYLAEKHFMDHSKIKTFPGSNWLCRLPRCNAPVHSSLNQLQEHIKTSHVLSAVLPCPISTCTSHPLHLGQLQYHFNKDHSELNGAVQGSGLLLPQWIPFHPSSYNIPALPKQNSPGTCLTKHVIPCHVSVNLVETPQAGRYRRRLMQSNLDTPEESMPTVAFDSLSRSEGADEDLRWFTTLHPSWSMLRDMSHPQGMHGTIHCQVVSQTIHYAVFAKKIGMEGAPSFK